MKYTLIKPSGDRADDYARLRKALGKRLSDRARPIYMTHYLIGLLLQRINVLEGGPFVDYDFYETDGDLHINRVYPGLNEEAGAH